MAALKYWIWLSELAGVNQVGKLKLLQHFGSPEDVYYAAPDDYGQVEGIKREQIDILQDKSLQKAEYILQNCAKENAFLITMDDALYPLRLKDIYDPPILLYGKGKMPIFDDEVAISLLEIFYYRFFIYTSIQVPVNLPSEYRHPFRDS